MTPSLPIRKAVLSAALLAAVAAASCATSPPQAPGAAGVATTVEGTITAIDLQPWMYDGNGVVTIDAGERGRVAVQLPARWNLCKAAAVDVEALAVGVRVQAVGAMADDGLVVCEGATHRLVPSGQVTR